MNERYHTTEPPAPDTTLAPHIMELNLLYINATWSVRGSADERVAIIYDRLRLPKSAKLFHLSNPPPIPRDLDEADELVHKCHREPGILMSHSDTIGLYFKDTPNAGLIHIFSLNEGKPVLPLNHTSLPSLTPV